MIPFLDSFLRNFPAVQTKQLLRLLNQMRDRGEIRSPEEFQTKLTELADLMQQEELQQRTPPLSFEEGDLLESDAMRTFMEFARLDMEASLGETERLGNAIRAHHKILAENYFDAIEAGLEELEAEVRAYEVLDARKYTGFSKVLKHYNFTGSIAVPGGDPETDSILFEDARGGEELALSPPRIGEPGMHLGVAAGSAERAIYFDSIEVLTDSTTPSTALSTSPDGNTPTKAIDGSKDTAWRHSILLAEDPDVCRLKLALTFSAAQRVNALAIDPLADVAIKVADISYVDSGGREISLTLGSTHTGSTSAGGTSRKGHLAPVTTGPAEWAAPNRRKVIPLGDIIAKKIILTLQQDTGVDGEFFYSSDLGSWRSGEIVTEFLTAGVEVFGDDPVPDEIPRALSFLGGPPTLPPRPARHWVDPSPVVESLTLDEDMTPPDEPPPARHSIDRLRATFSEYAFGFRDISAIAREYKPNGLFIPEPFELSPSPTTVALHRIAEFPSESTDIEFLLRKENYDADGLLLDVETIAIQPYGDDSVDERLFLSQRVSSAVLNDVGVLRFYPDFDETFSVYMDTTLLTIGMNYEVSVDRGVTWEITLPPSATASDPRECRVKLSGPRTDKIFRVVYTPLVSTSSAGGEVFLNPLRSARLGRFQTYVFDNDRPSGAVVRCRMGLQIILRANTLNTRVSPYLREVVLLGG